MEQKSNRSMDEEKSDKINLQATLSGQSLHETKSTGSVKRSASLRSLRQADVGFVPVETKRRSKTQATKLQFKRFYLLLWKNYLLRKRAYLLTVFELLIPTILFGFVAYVHATEGSIKFLLSERVEGEATYGTDFNQSYLIDLARQKFNDEGNRELMYSPDNNVNATDIVTKVCDELNIGGGTLNAVSKKDEKEIEDHFTSIVLDEEKRKKFKGAVIFYEASVNVIRYKIRLPVEVVYESTSQYKPKTRFIKRDTEKLFPDVDKNLPGPHKDNIDSYSQSGFLGLQILIDQFAASVITEQEFEKTIVLKSFPYPKYTRYEELNKDAPFHVVVGGAFLVGLTAVVPFFFKNVVSEKETGIRELMKLNGFPGWMQVFAWFLNTCIMSCISIAIILFLIFTPFDGKGGFINHSDPTLWFFMLLLTVISTISFLFFISAFFKSATFATAIGTTLWLGLMIGMFFALKDYEAYTFGFLMAFALLPQGCVFIACKYLGAFEARGFGAQWNSIGDGLHDLDKMNLGYVALMCIVDSVMYMCLAASIENVLPSEFELRKPWYLFQPITTLFAKLCRSRRKNKMPAFDDFEEETSEPGFEPHPPGGTVGIYVKNLRKQFGAHKTAVDGLSMKMYDSEIFALLGHNGAGKTTTISMLAGMFPPTSGTARINGHDITKEFDLVRENLGLCPQHNMLFDNLTAKEHLILFGQMNGQSSSKAKKDTATLIEMLQLSSKSNALSKDLSGGQKRKVCLGMALIGGAKVVILDEPTSGMDPEARRAIWDVLLKLRSQRTILLTTHFMEEADVLGDRIGIMAAGKLHCCGSGSFLKSFYGTGYTLKLTLFEKGDKDVIFPVVQKHIPDASLKPIRTLNEIFIALPTQTATTSALSALFSELTESKEELHIDTLGLSIATMDEVFLRVGKLTSSEEEEVEATPTAARLSESRGSTFTELPKRKKVGLVKSSILTLKVIFVQYLALSIKKWLYTLRKIKLLIGQVLIPVILVIASVLWTKSAYEPHKLQPKLDISLEKYEDPIVLFETNIQSANLATQVNSVLGKKIAVQVPSVKDRLEKVAKEDIFSFRQRHIVAGVLNVGSSEYEAWFNTIPIHAAPLAINLASNARIKTHPYQPKFQLSIQPLQTRQSLLVEAATDAEQAGPVIGFRLQFLICAGLALLTSSFILMPVDERLSKAKQVQLMTGLHPINYWMTAVTWDFFAILMVVAAMTLCFLFFQSYDIFTAEGGFNAVFFIFLVYGSAALPLTYICSTFPKTLAGGFAIALLLQSLPIFLFWIINMILPNNDVLHWMGRLFPMNGAGWSLEMFAQNAARNVMCNMVRSSTSLTDTICRPNGSPTLNSLRGCCRSPFPCERLQGVTCFVPRSYLSWEFFDAKLNKNKAGIGQELLYLVILAIVLQSMLVPVEFGVFRTIRGKMIRSKETEFYDQIEDSDVKEESERVTEMVVKDQVDDDALVVSNLCKAFGSFAAVSKLSFGVHLGECFGLLGTNGAGKTTTFRMITGDELRSFGEVYAGKITIGKNRRKFLANIGYCPQFDAIIECLTGKEMLQLFARLRGIPWFQVNAEVDKWLERVGLTKSAKVQCGKYSGGMKRRLSAAMAMIGDPPLILLDEPTSGVDPVSRRQFWKILDSVKGSGQAIILTSHSMDECEALCSRLGIMVNGQLQCLGGVQHLKHKFAQGYSLTFRLKQEPDPNLATAFQGKVEVLHDEICEKFEPCVLKDEHENILQYHVQNTNMAWDAMYKSLEELKESNQDLIEDYSVNETTLEEVFLSFARKQYGPRQAKLPYWRRFVTCQLGGG